MNKEFCIQIFKIINKNMFRCLNVKRNIFLVFIKTNSIFEDKIMNHICRAKKCKNLKHPRNLLVMLQTINKYINGQLFLPQDHKMNKSHQYQSIFGVNGRFYNNFLNFVGYTKLAQQKPGIFPILFPIYFTSRIYLLEIFLFI